MAAFSSLAKILGERSTIGFPPAIFKIFKWTLIPLFRPGSVHRGLAS